MVRFIQIFRNLYEMSASSCVVTLRNSLNRKPDISEAAIGGVFEPFLPVREAGGAFSFSIRG